MGFSEQFRNELAWAMPDWLEPYRELIGETDGHAIEELMNDWQTGFADNYMRAARLMAVNAQIELLERLRREGYLVPERVRTGAGRAFRA